MRRLKKLNSLLVEVICKVLQKEVKNPYISELITITKADITKDLRYAKIYFLYTGSFISFRSSYL